MSWQRDGTNDSRAVSAGTFDVEGTPDQAGAIIHNTQSHASGAALKVWKRKAVILNCEHDAIGAVREINGNVFGFPVLDGVGHGLLRDFIKLAHHAMLQSRDGTLRLEPAAYLEQFLCMGRQLGQSGL